MQEEVLRLVPARTGHFRLESGHHGDRWLDLERLCLRPEPVRQLGQQLAARLAKYAVEVVCGPLVEGAFVALSVASELGVPFTYADRLGDVKNVALFATRYRIPAGLRAEVSGKRVAIVNDVIGAGSAVRGTLADLKTCGAKTVVIGALLVLGHSASTLAADEKVALEAVASLPNTIWTPSECPLCYRGIPLTHAVPVLDRE
jgi:orotate phosphoribosyltransferase